MLKWITTTLAVAGDEWPEEDILDADEAVEWITEARGTGHTNVAFVKDEATARDVLAGLGLDDAEVEDRMTFAAGTLRVALDHSCGCQG